MDESTGTEDDAAVDMYDIIIAQDIPDAERPKHIATFKILYLMSCLWYGKMITRAEFLKASDAFTA